MKRAALFLPLVLSSGLSMGSSIDVYATNPDPVTVGVFNAGDTLTVSVQGYARLAQDPLLTDVLMYPDGSLIPTFCPPCGTNYSYFEQGQAYPSVAGGDGINHFAGGGGNYDIYVPLHWATEGPQTTDTQDPNAIRFGSLAYQWDSGEWATLGFGGTLVSPGGELHAVVVDAVGAYGNNSGVFSMTWDTIPSSGVPEPTTMLLLGGGLAILGLWRKRSPV